MDSASAISYAKSVQQTVEEVSHQPDGATPSAQGCPCFTGPDCSDNQKNLSDQTSPEDEAINCSLDVEKATQNTPGGPRPMDEDPLATRSTDATREANPQGVCVEE